MSADLGKEMKRLVLAGIGAVATTAEKSQALLDELVKKGEITVDQGKVLNEELKHNVREALGVDPSVDALVEKMTPEQRKALKEKLQSMDEAQEGKAHDDASEA